MIVGLNRSLKNTIVERRRVEEALRGSEKRFGSLVSNIAGAVYRCACDEHWTMAYMSDAIEEVCGYPASDFLNNEVRSYASIIHPDDQALVEEAVLGAVERKMPFTVRYRILDAQGEVRWVWERGVGVFNDDEVRYLDGAIFDVTDQQRAEDALRESEDRYKRLVETTNVIPWEADLSTWQFTYVGPQAFALLGYPLDDWYGAGFWPNSIHPDDRDEAVAFCQASRRLWSE